MATTAASSPVTEIRAHALLRGLGALGLIAGLTVVGVAVAAKLPGMATPLAAAAAALTVSLTAWMFFNERYEWSLAFLMVYLGLADGFLKLGTGVQAATLVRDLLFYAIVVGALVRLAVRRERLTLPPLSGWVIAWALVVLVEVANPHNGTLLHSVASVRPHVEWVPLFFLGYLIFRSKARIRNFLLLFAAIAAINGVVGLVQQNLTPDQLSSWGPGYAEALKGESSVSARTFSDESGVERNRPFALGGDIGFGGTIGFLAVPAVLALLALPLGWRTKAAVGVMAIGVVLGIASSASRTDVIAGIVAALVFAGLTVTSRGGVKTLVGVAAGLAIAFAALSVLSSDSEAGSFERYNTIASPGQALSTAYSYRSGVLAEVPNYIVKIPLGGGLGSKGPAGSFAGGGGGKGLNGESEPTFLLIEVGVPGLAVMLGFNLVLFYLSLTRIRRIGDWETRILLTGVAAALFALFATWFSGISTATVPDAPYLWLAGGILSYWLLGEGHARLKAAGQVRPRPTSEPARAPRWSNA